MIEALRLAVRLARGNGGRPVIELRNVSKEYPKRGFALRDVTLSVEKGAFAFLTGHSGSGEIDGDANRPHGRTPHDRPRGRGGLQRKGRAQARPLAGAPKGRFRLSGLSSPARAHGHGEYRLRAPRNGHAPAARSDPRLSGYSPRSAWLRNRVLSYTNSPVANDNAFASRGPWSANRTYCWRNEPTGNLDEAASKGIMEIFRKLNSAGTTILMATHDLDIVRSMPGAIRFELLHGEAS